MDLGLVFRSSGQLELVLCIGGGRQYVLHENKLKPAGFKLLAEGIEICFDNRKIYFTQNIAYEGDKKYICTTYGLLKSVIWKTMKITQPFRWYTQKTNLQYKGWRN